MFPGRSCIAARCLIEWSYNEKQRSSRRRGVPRQSIHMSPTVNAEQRCYVKTIQLRRAIIMAKLQVVPKVAPGSVTLDQIPADFIEEFEGAWKDLQANPNTELRVEFESKAERLSWLSMARSYGEQRMDDSGDSAKLKVRATPKRNLPDEVAYISITRDLPGDGAVNTHK